MPTNPTSNKNKFSSFEEWFQWEIKHEDKSWKLVNNSTGEIHSGGDEALNEWIAYSREITPDEINPTKKHKATIIFLHGIELSKRAHPFNLTGENVKMLIPHPHIKYIFPQAPVNDWDLRDTYGASLGFTNKFTNWFNIRGLGTILSFTGRIIGEKKDILDKRDYPRYIEWIQ